MAKTDLDFDFGFTAMDAEELDAVQEQVQAVSQATAVATEVKNPEKEYIYWPNRMDKVESFRDQLTEVYKS